jgi:hypothetical protein
MFGFMRKFFTAEKRTDNQAKIRQSHFKLPIELRMVTIMDPVKNCEMQFVTNKFELPPATIVDIYKDRW